MEEEPFPTSTTTSTHSPCLSTGLVSRGLQLYLTLSLKCLAYGKPRRKLFFSKIHREHCQKKSSVHFMYKWTEVPDERRPCLLSARQRISGSDAARARVIWPPGHYVSRGAALVPLLLRHLGPPSLSLALTHQPASGLQSEQTLATYLLLHLS